MSKMRGFKSALGKDQRDQAIRFLGYLKQTFEQSNNGLIYANAQHRHLTTFKPLIEFPLNPPTLYTYTQNPDNN